MHGKTVPRSAEEMPVEGGQQEDVDHIAKDDYMTKPGRYFAFLKMESSV